MSACIKIKTTCRVNDMRYVKGETYTVPDYVASALFNLGGAVPGDEQTAARVRRGLEWTEAPPDTRRSGATNWIKRIA